MDPSASSFFSSLVFSEINLFTAFVFFCFNLAMLASNFLHCLLESTSLRASETTSTGNPFLSLGAVLLFNKEEVRSESFLTILPKLALTEKFLYLVASILALTTEQVRNAAFKDHIRSGSSSIWSIKVSTVAA
jgi:hypothetical protein